MLWREWRTRWKLYPSSPRLDSDENALSRSSPFLIRAVKLFTQLSHFNSFGVGENRQNFLGNRSAKSDKLCWIKQIPSSSWYVGLLLLRTFAAKCFSTKLHAKQWKNASRFRLQAIACRTPKLTFCNRSLNHRFLSGLHCPLPEIFNKSRKVRHSQTLIKSLSKLLILWLSLTLHMSDSKNS